MTRRHVMVILMATFGIGSLSAPGMPPALIWNGSASAPVGLYAIEPADGLAVPELVAVTPPEPLARFMTGRGYAGHGIPLLKRVLALSGQSVCRTGNTIAVDAVEMGQALERDRKGRPMPVWEGCHRLGDHELFLMNHDVRDSLDGRYFGPVPTHLIVGRALPLWTDEDGDGRFEWRAPTR